MLSCGDSFLTKLECIIFLKLVLKGRKILQLYYSRDPSLAYKDIRHVVTASLLDLNVLFFLKNGYNFKEEYM